MKKVITAIGNPNLNYELRKICNIEVFGKDIIYKEGIIEYLEENGDIDIVILNEELCGENLNDFINQLAKYDIQIFLVLNGNSKHYIENFEKIANIKIFENNDEIISEFKGEKSNITPILKNNRKIISILGSNGVGKTVIASILGKIFAKNYKVLIIDFDIFNNNLSYLFNIKSKIRTHEIKSLIEKVDKNLYILDGIKYIFNETNKIDTYKVKELLDELKCEYDYILIDTSSEYTLGYIKTIIPNCDFNIFILEANILEIKKAKDLLEVYMYDYELDINKIGLIINKLNFEVVDLAIVKEVFNDMNVIANIKYNNKFNSYINSFTKNIIKIDSLININKFLEEK